MICAACARLVVLGGGTGWVFGGEVGAGVVGGFGCVVAGWVVTGGFAAGAAVTTGAAGTVAPTGRHTVLPGSSNVLVVALFAARRLFSDTFARLAIVDHASPLATVYVSVHGAVSAACAAVTGGAWVAAGFGLGVTFFGAAVVGASVAGGDVVTTASVGADVTTTASVTIATVVATVVVGASVISVGAGGSCPIEIVSTGLKLAASRWVLPLRRLSAMGTNNNITPTSKAIRVTSGLRVGSGGRA